ncbi:DUF6475 domain-containing protein [Robbsia andropogonis]|uniref:DUF6475 domain-containing protein n=1 Tax=Robbsia andropogonis TaxID=28092 RepID=UPI00046755E8|nr:DUF6475 domain-containing protein [Robbsia andropogonis]
MRTTDMQAFTKLLADVHAFYRQDFSDFAASVWAQAMRPYDFPAIADAFGRHTVNADTGQFMPKPADIVKMLGGTSQDAALVAWAKVDKALRQVGTYASVVFDDPLIHHVLTDMGGWVPLGAKTEDEWPFVRNEFVTRYRGCKVRSETPAYLSVLVGISDAQNQRSGYRAQEPVLIGNASQCRQVLMNGSKDAPMGFTRLSGAQAGTKVKEIVHEPS